MNYKLIFERFLLWRSKHLSHKYYVLFLSVVVGLLSGTAALIIKNLVFFIQWILTSGFAKDYHNYLYFAYPFIGLLITVYFVKKVVRQPVSHGIPNTLYAISKRNSNIRRHNIFSSIITSALTVGFGGSCGLEGPTVVTSAAWSSNLGRALNLNYKTKTLLIGCAAAGSMASLFNAPIAAIVFAIEVFMLDLTMSSMIPLLLASASAAITSRLFLGDEVLFHVKIYDAFSIQHVFYYVLLGIFCGLLSAYFSKVYFLISQFFERLKASYPKAILGGILLGIIVFVLPPLYGEGYDTINALINGKPLKLLETSLFYEYKNDFWVLTGFLLAVILFKAIATTITFGSGGVGGIFAPSLFVGSVAGYLFSRMINYIEFSKLSYTNFTLAGMGGFMAGVLHSPLTAIFLIAEITGGYDLFIPLMITASIAYLTAKYFNNHSVYTMQLAKRGELITHDKDRAILTLMQLKTVIENDFVSVHIEGKLSDVVKAIQQSNRNIFPVLDDNKKFYGFVLLDDIRNIMFKKELHDIITVLDVLTVSPAEISSKDSMDIVMRKFEETEAWNLPVIDHGIYVGFVSKSKLFSAYRNLLMEFYNEG